MMIAGIIETLSLTGYSEEDKTIEYYRSHLEEMKKTLKECRNNLGCL